MIGIYDIDNNECGSRSSVMKLLDCKLKILLAKNDEKDVQLGVLHDINWKEWGREDDSIWIKKVLIENSFETDEIDRFNKLNYRKNT